LRAIKVFIIRLSPSANTIIIVVVVVVVVYRTRE